jgi:hypothetical protein
MTDEEDEKSSKSRVIYGTYRTMSGQHDAKGNFKTRYDSGEQIYEKRVPPGDHRTTAKWLREKLGLAE